MCTTHTETTKDFYDQVYSQDNPSDIPHGWIQWKGTDVCIDLHCSCGAHCHIDAKFFYFYECVCGKRYAVGQVVKLIELTKEQIEDVINNRTGFVKGDDEIDEEEDI